MLDRFNRERVPNEYLNEVRNTVRIVGGAAIGVTHRVAVESPFTLRASAWKMLNIILTLTKLFLGLIHPLMTVSFRPTDLRSHSTKSRSSPSAPV